MRPSELPPAEPQRLRDEEVPDFLEAHRVAALAFVDLQQASSRRVVEKLRHVAARLRDEAAVGVVEVTHHRLVAEAMGVKSVPLVVVFLDGALVDRLMGDPPEAILDETIRTRLPSPHRSKDP